MSKRGEPNDEERNPLDWVLDLSVYAPLGFALEFRRLVPELAEAGRRQIEFSRSLGRAALRTMAQSGATSAAAPQRTSRAATAPDQDAGTTAAGAESGDSAAPVPEEPVEGFDAMNARAAIAAARGATVAQLVWMRNREIATKNRTTVLQAIERAVDG